MRAWVLIHQDELMEKKYKKLNRYVDEIIAES